MDQVHPHLQLVEMLLGKVVYEPEDVLRYAYFPTDCMVSLLYVLEDGVSTEISIVGNDGLIGLTLFMRGGTVPSRAVVRSRGHAYRPLGQTLRVEFHRNATIRPLLPRYTQVLITQMAQTVVCTGITRWTGNCAAESCHPWTACSPARGASQGLRACATAQSVRKTTNTLPGNGAQSGSMG